jgi:hypothetical protein
MPGLHTIPLIIALLANVVLGANLGPFWQDENKDWAEISKLHDRAWEQSKSRQVSASQSTFSEAAKKLKKYRSQYYKDRSSLSFLRATFRLANLSELGNRDKDAREFYEECLNHPLINSSAAVADQQPILSLVRKRMAVVDERLKPRSHTSEFPRIKVEGGSKGGHKDLPPRTSDLHP